MSIDVRLGDNRLIRFLPDSLKEKILIMNDFISRICDEISRYLTTFLQVRLEKSRKDSKLLNAIMQTIKF